MYSSNNVAMLSIIASGLALIQSELKEHKVKFIIFKNDLFDPVFELELVVVKVQGLLNTYTILFTEDTWAF